MLKDSDLAKQCESRNAKLAMEIAGDLRQGVAVPSLVGC